MTTPITSIAYQCDKCGAQYDSIEGAEKCEREHPDIHLYEISGISSKKVTSTDFPERIVIKTNLYPMKAIYQFSRIERK